MKALSSRLRNFNGNRDNFEYRVGRYDGRKLEEKPASKCLSFHGQPAALIVIQPEAFSLVEFFQNPVFLEKVVNDLLLMPVDPA